MGHARQSVQFSLKARSLGRNAAQLFLGDHGWEDAATVLGTGRQGDFLMWLMEPRPPWQRPRTPLGTLLRDSCAACVWATPQSRSESRSGFRTNTARPQALLPRKRAHVVASFKFPPLPCHCRLPSLDVCGRLW